MTSEKLYILAVAILFTAAWSKRVFRLTIGDKYTYKGEVLDRGTIIAMVIIEFMLSLSGWLILVAG